MTPSLTMQNIESAFGGESQAHVKYRFFAKVCRKLGDEETAKVFEATADQEILHAYGHFELLHRELTVEDCLKLAIEGETHEFTEMYPSFRKQAETDGNAAAAAEAAEQIAESKVHAAQFTATLEKARKRFAALQKVEERHANHYRDQLARVVA